MKLILPEPLIQYANHQSQLALDVTDLAALKTGLQQTYPELADVLFENDQLNGFVALFLDDQPVNLSSNVVLHNHSQLRVICAISGG